MKNKSYYKFGYLRAGIGFGVLLGLYGISLANYLLFHSLTEFFSIVIACGIFMIAWNTRTIMDNNYLLFLGTAYLFIGGLDMVHTLAYKGMGVFHGYDADLPTQLWIAARAMESLTLFLAPLLIRRRLKCELLLLCYALACGLLIVAVFTDRFPHCYVEGVGLTPFKIISEYVISLVLVAGGFLLVRERNRFDEPIFRLLITSIVLSIGAELAFTFYISVYGLSNLIGHLFKLISFYLVYRAIIVNGLIKPHHILFRNLKQNEEALLAEREKLKEALAEIKVLGGLLPICSICKKIRDDRGYWNTLELYLEKHTDAAFSHGICPECLKTHYPDFTDEDE